MVNPRFVITFPDALNADPRFLWVPVHPLPNHSGNHVRHLSLDDLRDDTDITLGGAK